MDKIGRHCSECPVPEVCSTWLHGLRRKHRVNGRNLGRLARSADTNLPVHFFSMDINTNFCSTREMSMSELGLPFFVEPVDCLNAEGQNYFIVALQMKVEPPKGLRDDTAANNVKFKCRLFNQYRNYELEGRGGPWGKWGDWSQSCPIGSAVCGIQVCVRATSGV